MKTAYLCCRIEPIRPVKGLTTEEGFAGVTGIGFTIGMGKGFAGVTRIGFAGVTRIGFAGVTRIGFAGVTENVIGFTGAGTGTGTGTGKANRYTILGEEDDNTGIWANPLFFNHTHIEEYRVLASTAY